MLSLYVHIPFCVRKCPYCGFFSTRYDSALADRYLRALREELTMSAPFLEGRHVGTIYIGGGTPSTLSPGQFTVLADALFGQTTRFSSGTEVTVEVNPGTASPDLFSLLRSLGATRLSIGAQAFSDEVLRALGRVHGAEDARRAFAMARAAGFGNIGLDLMYAVPGQTDGQWAETLDDALRLAPDHLSVYSLSLDEGSRFFADASRGRVVLPSDEAAAGQYSMACDRLERHGYRRYELSNFSRPGFACRHNLNYWSRGEYLGIGAGAWSFLRGVRWANLCDVEGYIGRIARRETVRSFEERPGPAEAASEALFLGLRTAEGIDLERFAACHGTERSASLLAAVERHWTTGLYEVHAGRLRLTQRGALLANDAMEALLP